MKRLLSIMGLAALVTASGAMAETVMVKGTGMGSSDSMQMPVSDGLVVVHNRTSYDGFDTEDPESPFASLSGSCFGATLVEAGAVSGSGNCHYTDADGDQAVMAWTATGMSEEGRVSGDWSVVGGTGKWAEASGGGTFDAGGEGADYTNMVTGEVEMP